LVPTKEGKYFQFDERCEADLERIKEMKDMDFSLHEIKTILLLGRFSKLTLGQERQHYRSFFRNKMKELIKEQELLTEKIFKLEEKVKRIEEEFQTEPIQLGINIGFLPKLYCPKCQEPLNLDAADIQANMILNGQLSCECGYTYEVKDGILTHPESLRKTEETDETDFIKYVDETNDNFLDNIYAAMSWCHKSIELKDTPNQTVLELGVGNGILLSHIYNDLPDKTTYVAVDYDFYKLRYVKRVLERSGIKKNILFLCCDYKHLPLREKTIDYVIDFFGMSSYSFKNKSFLHDVVNRYYKDNVTLIATFMLFDQFKQTSEITPDQYYLFKKDGILKALKGLNYKKRDDYLFGYSEEGEKDGVVFEVTNRIYIYGYLGNKSEVLG
jgi:ubiquinone/menaquinone biosynthesis C-methylase UbiE/DNA-binding transcriptional MerR regulator